MRHRTSPRTLTARDKPLALRERMAAQRPGEGLGPGAVSCAFRPERLPVALAVAWVPSPTSGELDRSAGLPRPYHSFNGTWTKDDMARGDAIADKLHRERTERGPTPTSRVPCCPRRHVRRRRVLRRPHRRRRPRALSTFVLRRHEWPLRSPHRRIPERRRRHRRLWRRLRAGRRSRRLSSRRGRVRAVSAFARRKHGRRDRR
jgi:hypothetical protein